MGIVSRLLTPTNQRSDGRIMGWLRGGGGAVTPDNATQIAVVFSCVRVLAESVAMLPLEMRARDARGSRAATELPLYQLLHDLPNPDMTSMDLRMMLMGHLATWGNAYAQKVPDRSGRWIELWPLAVNRMEAPVRGTDGQLYYPYQEASGEKRTFAGSEILHIRGLSSDGLVGLSPISVARRAFERKQQMEQFEQAFYANNAQPGAVLRHPGKLSDKAYDRLRESWESRHMGPTNANRLAVLEEGLDVTSIGVPQSDAQFLESQKLTRNEIAGLFRVPSHMVNDLDRATFSNIEMMSLEFVIYTLMPWLVVWEQAINRSLLSDQQRGRYYAKHVVQALLRGDNASRAAYYQTGLQNGWMSINDVRELEDANPITNGDTYMVPLNMVPLDQAVKGMAPAPAGGQASVRAYLDADHAGGCTCGQCGRSLSTVDSERRADGEDQVEELRLSRVEMARAMQPVMEDIAARIVKRESRDVRRLVDKHLRKRSNAEFLDGLRQLYLDFDGVVSDNFRAALLSYARQAMMAAGAELGKKSKGLTDELRQFVNDYLATLGTGWAASSRTQLEIVLSEALDAGTDPAEAIEERLTRWDETKAQKTGERQTFEALNALVIASYGAYGITRIRWAASGASCPFCRQLSGKVAGIEEHFVADGDVLHGGDAAPMQLKRNVRHGPLHGGCDCVVVAEG
jgi:HK97 family phage portal protein